MALSPFLRSLILREVSVHGRYLVIPALGEEATLYDAARTVIGTLPTRDVLPLVSCGDLVGMWAGERQEWRYRRPVGDQ